jgi:hypothetical protein
MFDCCLFSFIPLLMPSSFKLFQHHTLHASPVADNFRFRTCLLSYYRITKYNRHTSSQCCLSTIECGIMPPFFQLWSQTPSYHKLSYGRFAIQTVFIQRGIRSFITDKNTSKTHLLQTTHTSHQHSSAFLPLGNESTKYTKQATGTILNPSNSRWWVVTFKHRPL